MESNSGPSVREASTLTIKPRGILINVGSIALYMTYYFTRGSLGTKVELNMVFARSDDSLWWRIMFLVSFENILQGASDQYSLDSSANSNHWSYTCPLLGKGACTWFLSLGIPTAFLLINEKCGTIWNVVNIYISYIDLCFLQCKPLFVA